MDKELIKDILWLFTPMGYYSLIKSFFRKRGTNSIGDVIEIILLPLTLTITLLVPATYLAVWILLDHLVRG